MKITTRILILIVFLLTGTISNAQTPPHPNGGKVPGSTGTSNAPVGGGAPIGGGNLILMVMAVAYAGTKFKQNKAEPGVPEN